MTTIPIRRALLSVSDKAGIVDLGRTLAARGVELVSTGGTAKALRDAGLAVRDVSELTGFPEMMDGRVKTLHPMVHGGLLAVRDDPDHAAAMAAHGIGAIDLVVVNLYPFEATVAKGAGRDEVIENIDIGGPSMVRSAAKNHAYVAIVTDPADYATVARGETTLDERQRLAAKAFAATAAYDAAIAGWFAFADQGERFPETLPLVLKRGPALRYGENPHQAAAFYTPAGPHARGIGQARQVQGKELSYNNLNDADAALELVAEFRDALPTCVIVKHANPCGVASAETLAAAYAAAFACDSVSAFGGIVAVNRPLDGVTARAIAGIFTEVVVAPDADEEALAVFAAKKNLRLLLTGELPDAGRPGLAVKSIAGGWLVQGRDDGRPGELSVVTKRQPTPPRAGRLPLRMDGGQARQVERDRLCARRRDRRRRRGADEPAGIGTHRRVEGEGRRRPGGLGRAAHGRLGGGVGRVLPLRRRADGGSRGGCDGGDPAGRVDPRRRGDRGGGRGGAGDGVHGDATLPALSGRRRVGQRRRRRCA